MAQKKNSKRPVVTTSADTEVQPMFYAVMRLNEEIDVTDVWGNTTVISLSNDTTAGHIPVFRTIEEAKHWANNGKYTIIAIQPC